MNPPRLLAVALLASAALAQTPSPLERYIEEAQRAPRATRPAAGSLYASAGPLSELASDPRARHVNDLITILVVEQATAVSRGATSSKRASSARGGLGTLYGRTYPRLGSLASASGSTQLEGEGSTSRGSTRSEERRVGKECRL